MIVSLSNCESAVFRTPDVLLILPQLLMMHSRDVTQRSTPHYLLREEQLYLASLVRLPADLPQKADPELKMMFYSSRHSALTAFEPNVANGSVLKGSIVLSLC